MESDEQINDSGVSLITADRVLSPPYGDAAADDDTVDLYDDLMLEENDNLQQEHSQNHAGQNNSLDITGVQGSEIPSASANEVSMPVSSQQTSGAVKLNVPVDSEHCSPDLLDDCLLKQLNREESIKKLVSKIKHLQKENEKVQSQALILQKNMALLWKTARTQLKEKDEKIGELHRKYESLVFRRSMRSIGESDLEQLMKSISSYTPARMHQFLQELRGGRVNKKRCASPFRKSRTSSDVKSAVRGTLLSGNEANVLLPLLPSQQQRLVSGVSVLGRDGPDSTSKLETTKDVRDDAVTARKGASERPLPKNSGLREHYCNKRSAKRVQISRTTRLIKQARNVLKRRRCSVTLSPRRVREVQDVNNDATISADVTALSINEAPCSIVSSSQIEASNRQTENLDDYEGKQRDTNRFTRHSSKVDLLTNTNLHMNKISEASTGDRLFSTALASGETEEIPDKIMRSGSKRQEGNRREHHLHHQKIGLGNLPDKRKSTRQTQIGNGGFGLANSRSSKENDKPDCNKKSHDKGSSIGRLSPVSKSKSRPSRSFSPNQIVHSRSRSHSEEKHRRLSSRQCSPSLRLGSHHETLFHGGRPYDRKIKDIRPYQRRRTDSKPLRFSPRSRVSRNPHPERDDMYYGRRRIDHTKGRNHRNRRNTRETRCDNRSLSFNPRSTRQSMMQSKERKETSRRTPLRRKNRVRSVDMEQDLQRVVADSTMNPKVCEEHVDVKVRWQNETSRNRPEVLTLVDAHDTERLALERSRLLAELKVIEELEAPSLPLPSKNIAVSDNQLGLQETKNADEHLEFQCPSAHNAYEHKLASDAEQNVTCDISNSEGFAKVVDIVGTSSAARAITSSRCPRAVDESHALEQQRYNTEKYTNQKLKEGNVSTVLPNAILDAHAGVPSVIQVVTGDELDNTIKKGQKCSGDSEEKIQNSSRIVPKNENTSLISRSRLINMDDTIDKIVKNYNENNPSLSPVPSETSLLHFLERSRNEPEFSAVTFKNALDLSNCDIDGDPKEDCCKGQPVSYSGGAAAGAAPDCGRCELAPQLPAAIVACNKSDQVSTRNAKGHDLYSKNVRQIRRIHPTRMLPGTHTTASALLKSQIVELVPVKEYTLKPKLRLPTSSTEVISSNRLSFESSSRSCKKSTKKSAGVGKSTDVSDDERDIGNSDSSHSATDMSEVSKDSFIAKTSDEEILTNSKNTLDLTFLNLDLSLSVDSIASATSQCKINSNQVSPQKGTTSSTADQWAESPAKNTRSQKHLSQKLTRRGVKAVSLIGKKLPQKPLSLKIQPSEETRMSQPLSRNNSESNSSSLRVPVSCDKSAVGSLSCSNSHGSSSLSSTSSSSSSSSSSSTNNSSTSSSAVKSASNSSLNDPNAANRSERRTANCEKNTADFGALNLSEAGGEVTVEKGRVGNDSPLRSAALREKFKALFACDSNDEGSSKQKEDLEQSLKGVDGNSFVSYVPRHVTDCRHSSPASSPQSLLSSKYLNDSSSIREHDVYGENQRIQKRLKLTKKGRRKLSANFSNSSKVISIVFNEESSTLCDGARTVNESTCVDMPNKMTSSDINTANSHQVMGMDFLKTGKSLQTVHHSSISTPTLMKVRKRILTTPDTIESRILRRTKKPVSAEMPTPKSNFDQGCAEGKTTPVMSVVSHSFESLPMPTSSMSSSVVPVSLVQPATQVVHSSDERAVTLPLSTVKVAKPSLSSTMLGTASSDSVMSCSYALSSASILLNSCLIASSNIKPSAGAEPRAYLPVAQSTVSSTEFGNSLLQSDHAINVVEEPRCISPPVGILPRLPSCSEEGILSSLSTKTALTSLTSVSAHFTNGQTMSTVPTFPVCQLSTESPISNDKTASNTSLTPVSVNAGHLNMKRDCSTLNPTMTQTEPTPVSAKSTENEAESHTSAKLETRKFSKVVNFSRKRRKTVKLSHS